MTAVAVAVPQYIDQDSKTYNGIENVNESIGYAQHSVFLSLPFLLLHLPITLQINENKFM